MFVPLVAVPAVTGNVLLREKMAGRFGPLFEGRFGQLKVPDEGDGAVYAPLPGRGEDIVDRVDHLPEVGAIKTGEIDFGLAVLQTGCSSSVLLATERFSGVTLSDFPHRTPASGCGNVWGTVAFLLDRGKIRTFPLWAAGFSFPAFPRKRGFLFKY